MRIPTYHLPGLSELPGHATALAEGIELEYAELTPQRLAGALDAVLAARVAPGGERSTTEVIDALARAGDVWQRNGSPWAAQARSLLPLTAGLSPAMIGATLPAVFTLLTREALHTFVESELGNAGALDDFVASPGGRRRAVGPALVAYVSAGNIPGLAVPGIVAGLLAKAAVFVKASAGDPVLPALLARSLAEIDGSLASRLAVACWPGGTSELDDVLLARADVVVVEGHDETVAALASRARGRVLGFGHRVSLAVIARDAPGDIGTVAEALARDVGLFDQHGCLSPQVVYVEAGGVHDAAGIATALGQALARLDGTLPRGPLAPEEAAAIRRFREEAEWRAVGDDGVRVSGSAASTGATVVFDPDPRFVPTCANRTVWVKPLERIDDLPRRLGPWSTRLEAVGVASTRAGMRRLAELLATTSTVSRVCAIGRMQEPAPGWRRGGMPRLGALVRWVEIEEPAPSAIGVPRKPSKDGATVGISRTRRPRSRA